MDTRRRKKGTTEKKLEDKKSSAKFKKAIKKSNNHFYGCFKAILLIDLGLFIGLVVGYYFSPIVALPMDDMEDIPLTGVFSPDNKFTSGIKIPNLNGPESVDVDDQGNVYAGLDDGRIVCIHKSIDKGLGLGEIENITSGIIKGAETTDGSVHGRAMGIRIRKKTAYIIDSVYGFYQVDLKTKVVTILVKPSDVTPTLKFPNDVDITKDKRFAYFTDSSSIYPMKTMADIGLLDGTCTGRVIRYEFKTNKVKEVARDLCFGNGIQLSSDEKKVVVSETGRSRIAWIEIESGKTFKAIPMPMMPDNIRRNRRGTYWIAGASPPSLLVKLSVNSPALRQAIAGFFPKKLIQLSMGLVLRYQYNIIVEMNHDGDTLRSVHDPNGEIIFGASQVTELGDGQLLLGSYLAPFAAIAKI